MRTGKFRIKSAKDGKIKMVSVIGQVFGIFGVHTENVLDEMPIFKVSHIPSGWLIQQFDTLKEAKGLVEELKTNPDWHRIETQGERVNSLPPSCQLQINNYNKGARK